MIEIANEVERRLRDEGFKKPLKIAIMGCVVNGPGEASDADIGIAGSRTRRCSSSAVKRSVC